MVSDGVCISKFFLPNCLTPKKRDVCDVSKELWKCCDLVSGMVVTPWQDAPTFGSKTGPGYRFGEVGAGDTTSTGRGCRASLPHTAGLTHHVLLFFHVFHHIFGSPPKITRLLMFIDVYAFGIRRRSDLESRLGIDLRYSALVVIWYPAMIYRVWKQVDVTKRGVGGIWRLQLPFIPGTQASLVVSTGQCWSTHHFACLIGCWDLFLGTGLYRIGSL